MTKKCLGPCGREFPATVEHFVRVGPGVLSRRCRACNRLRLSAVRKKTWDARRAAVEKAGKKRCGKCSHVFPLDRFTRLKDGNWHSYCRTCWNLWSRDYRRSAKYRKKRAGIHAVLKHREKALEIFHRTKAARPKRPASPKVHQHRFLKGLVRSGKLARPTRCSRCQRGAPHFRIVAWVHTPRPAGRPFDPARDVAWVCHPCLWVVHHPEPADERDPELEAHIRRQALARKVLSRHDRLSPEERRRPEHLRRLLEALQAPRGGVEECRYGGSEERALQTRFRASWTVRTPTRAEDSLRHALGGPDPDWRPEDHPAAE